MIDQCRCIGEMNMTQLLQEGTQSVDELSLNPRLLFALMFLSRGCGDNHLGCERRTWNTVLF